MKRNRILKHENSHTANERIRTMQGEAKYYKELVNVLKDITGGTSVKTLGALNEWLCARTGFESPSFSAKTMDKGTAYDRASTLSKSINFITPSSLNNFYQLKQTVIESVKEDYKTYYTEEEQDKIENFRRLQDEINALDWDVRGSLTFSRSYNLMSTTSVFNSTNFKH